MNKHITATEAKNRFGELLETVKTEPVFIRKNGRDVAVLISKEEFEERDSKSAKKALIQRLHEESMEKHADVYEALAK